MGHVVGSAKEHCKATGPDLPDGILMASTSENKVPVLVADCTLVEGVFSGNMMLQLSFHEPEPVVESTRAVHVVNALRSTAPESRVVVLTLAVVPHVTVLVKRSRYTRGASAC